MIFNNVIANAVRYRDARKESYLKIEIDTNHAGTVIRFTDNGIGIQEEYKDNIFRMFFHVDFDTEISSLENIGYFNRTVRNLMSIISCKNDVRTIFHRL